MKAVHLIIFLLSCFFIAETKAAEQEYALTAIDKATQEQRKILIPNDLI